MVTATLRWSTARLIWASYKMATSVDDHSQSDLERSTMAGEDFTSTMARQIPRQEASYVMAYILKYDFVHLIQCHFYVVI